MEENKLKVSRYSLYVPKEALKNEKTNIFKESKEKEQIATLGKLPDNDIKNNEKIEKNIFNKKISKEEIKRRCQYSEKKTLKIQEEKPN